MFDEKETLRVGAAEERTEKRRRAKILWSGFASSNAVGLLAMVITPFLIGKLHSLFSLQTSSDVAAVYGVATFLAIPLAMGIVSAWIWQPLKLTSRQLIECSAGNTALAIFGSAFVLREGVICLAMASLLFFGIIYLGCLLGNKLYERNQRHVQVSLLPLFALCLFLDSRSSDTINVVTDEDTIRANPTQVWKNVNSFPPITSAPNYWLFKVGMPMPIVSRLHGARVGAKRECILTGNLVFDERVTVWKPPQQLTFDIVHQPEHPELTGHFKLVRGEFRLRANENGTTTLTGTSWYKLNVRPLWYFG